MKKYAVIVAGGSGARMGAPLPKQFLLLQGKPVIHYTLEAFLQAYADIQVILVLPAAYLETAAEIVAVLSDPTRVRLCEGGATRFHSVQNGLQYAADPAVIFVHDGVRCLVSPQLIHACYNQAVAQGSAVPAVAITDSVRTITAEGTVAVDRARLRAVQTPQTFRSDILLPAFKQAYQEGFTDEATVVEAAGFVIHLVEGDKENIKITYPGDLALAEYLLLRHVSDGIKE